MKTENHPALVAFRSAAFSLARTAERILPRRAHLVTPTEIREVDDSGILPAPTSERTLDTPPLTQRATRTA